MKKLTIVLMFLILSMSVFAQVSITPSNPTDNDDLLCSVPGQNPSLLVFTWNNGATTNTIPASSTNPGETWTCSVSIPPTKYTGIINIGQAAVTIQNTPVVPPPTIINSGTRMPDYNPVPPKP